MESTDYTIAWVIYIIAVSGLSVLCWIFLRKFLWRDLAWLLQLCLMAFLFTPWYVFEDQTFLAPAYIVTAMDIITIGPEAGVRAMTPLVMALFAALLLSLLRSILVRMGKRGRRGDVAQSSRREPPDI